MSRLGKTGLLLSGVTLALASACLENEDKACGAGATLMNKVCIDDVGDGDGDTDAGALGDGDGDEACYTGVNPAPFGKTCKVATDCETGTDYCPVQPGTETGACSVQGCDVEHPEVMCPTGWTCFDLSVYSPGLPTYCKPPAVAVPAPTKPCTPAGVDPTPFGKTCMSEADCDPAANYCPIQPGGTTGACSVQGCDVNNPAEKCPTGYTCFDLSVYMPGLPTYCKAPM